MPEGTTIVGATCGGNGGDGRHTLYSRIFAALGVEAGNNELETLLFVARKGYPWQAVQQTYVSRFLMEIFNSPRTLETTIWQYPSYYGT